MMNAEHSNTKLLTMHINLLEYFIGVGVLIAAFLYLLVRKAGKESRKPFKPKREGIVVNLDEYEISLGGDMAHLEEVQSN
jgi:hypothetical protein